MHTAGSVGGSTAIVAAKLGACLIVVALLVADPPLSVTGLPKFAPSTRNCTVPVGDVPPAIVAVKVTESEVTVKTPDGTADCYFVHPSSGTAPGNNGSDNSRLVADATPPRVSATPPHSLSEVAKDRAYDIHQRSLGLHGDLQFQSRDENARPTTNPSAAAPRRATPGLFFTTSMASSTISRALWSRR